MSQSRAVACQHPRRQPWCHHVSRSPVWIQLRSKIIGRSQIFLLCLKSSRSSSWRSSLTTWPPTTCSQNISLASANTTLLKRRSSKSFPTFTLPSTRTRSPFSPFLTSVPRSTLCIDFSNSLLYGTSTYLLDRLQSVLNSSARLILKLGKYDPISAAIRRDLHWLPIQARIRFKMNVITRNCLVGQAPEYLAELCRPINEVPARRNLRSAAQVQLLVPRFRKERTGRRGFPSHPHNCGTYFQSTFELYMRSLVCSERY